MGTSKHSIRIAHIGHRYIVRVEGRPALDRAFFGGADAHVQAGQYAAELEIRLA